MTMHDPVFAAVARWDSANAAYAAAHARADRRWPHDRARAEAVANRATWNARQRALAQLYETRPETLNGLLALAAVFRQEEFEAIDDAGLGQAMLGLLEGIAHLARRRYEAGTDAVGPIGSAPPRAARSDARRARRRPR